MTYEPNVENWTVGKHKLSAILDYVDRTSRRGVPMRVCIARAAKKYDIDRQLLRGFIREGD